LTLVLSGQAYSQAAAEDQPRQEEGAAATDEGGGDQEREPIDLTSAFEGIETAIRDLITKENEVTAQQQQENEQRDLDAQEGMAWWAKLMFYATGATVLVTFAALVAIIKTLEQTKRAADYTKDMLVEAAEVTREAKSANQILREEQRPWIQVTHEIHSDFGWDREIDLGKEVPIDQRYFRIVVRTKIKNLGRLPAYDVNLHQEMIIEPPGVSGKPAFEAIIKRTLEPEYSGQVIFPGEEVVSDWSFGGRTDLLIERLGRNEGGRIFFGPYIFCSVGYEISSAVSNKKRFTAVSRSIEFKNGHSSLWLQALPIAADDLTIKRAPRGADKAT